MVAGRNSVGEEGGLGSAAAANSMACKKIYTPFLLDPSHILLSESSQNMTQSFLALRAVRPRRFFRLAPKLAVPNYKVTHLWK